MQFGFPTLIETHSLEKAAMLCSELGLHFIELNMNLPQYQVHTIGAAEFKDIAAKYGIYYTIHLDENLNPCDFNDLVAEAYTQTMLKVIDLAKVLGVNILNMHLNEGVHFTLPEKIVFLYEEYSKQYIEKLTAFRDRCSDAVGSSNLKLCVENTGGYECAPFLLRSLDVLLESPVFALTFDIGHNAAVNGSDEGVILSHKGKLMHMHVHDAVGKRHHLSLGSGELDIERYLALAKEHDCRAVLEVKSVDGLRASAVWLKERGFL
jgi:sugar phosphate isomerase/epimerase